MHYDALYDIIPQKYNFMLYNNDRTYLTVADFKTSHGNDPENLK